MTHYRNQITNSVLHQRGKRSKNSTLMSYQLNVEKIKKKRRFESNLYIYFFTIPLWKPFFPQIPNPTPIKKKKAQFYYCNKILNIKCLNITRVFFSTMITCPIDFSLYNTTFHYSKLHQKLLTPIPQVQHNVGTNPTNKPIRY